MTPSAVLNLPLAEAVAALFVIAMLRANATYWVGRGMALGAARIGLESRVPNAALRRGQALLRRWGVFAVPLSFLTIGVQTAVNGLAGAGRMPLRRYLPAVALGGLIWAVVYATVGLAAVYAAVVLMARSPWAFVALCLVVVAIVIVVRMRVVAARRSAPESHTLGA